MHQLAGSQRAWIVAAFILVCAAQCVAQASELHPADSGPEILRPPSFCQDGDSAGSPCRLWLIELPHKFGLPARDLPGGLPAQVAEGSLPADRISLIHRSAAYDIALAAGDADVGALLPGCPLRGLGPWRSDREYYLVHLASGRPPVIPPDRLGAVLHGDSATAILEVMPANAPLLHSSYSTERIFPRPLVAAPAVPPARKARRTPIAHDPGVQAMVDAVEIPEMHSTVQYLQDLRTRRSDAPGARQAQEYLVQRFMDFGFGEVETHSFNNWSDNVIAIKPGLVHPERIVVLGGHYDSISRSGTAPGADDNGSGTAGVLEVARILSAYDFKSTVYLVGWSGEEQGLVGSAYWTARAASLGMQIDAYVNLDMLGYLEGREDLDIISNQDSEWLRDLCFEAVPLYVPDLPMKDGFLTGGSSDHASFWAHGYPAVFFFEDSHSYSPYIHTSADVIGLSLNSFAFMRRNVQAALAVTAVLAMPYRLTIEHAPPEEHPRADEPLALHAVIRTAVALQPDSLLLRYRGGPSRFAALPLSPAGPPFEYRVELPPLPAGTVVEYYLEAVDADGRSATHPEGAPAAGLHSFVVGVEILYEDDFETDRGWTAGLEDDTAVSGMWVRAIPGGSAYQPDHNRTPGGAFCYVTGNAPPGAPDRENTVSGGITSLVSPTYDLRNASNVSLSYWRWYANEAVADDVLRVWISNNGGDDWLLLEEVVRTAVPWTQVRFDDVGRILPVTGRMRLMFTAEDQGLPSITEAAVDDVVWSGVRRSPFGTPERMPASLVPDGGTVFIHCRPNPAAGRSLIEFRLGSAGAVRLLVYDVRGRAVRVLIDSDMCEGDHLHSWDGRDDMGRAVPSGIYWVRLEAGGGVALAQTVRIR